MADQSAVMRKAAMAGTPEARTSEAKTLECEALGVALLAQEPAEGGILLVAHSEAQARRLAGMAHALASELRPLLLPAWDCLAFDRVSPSRAVMGARMCVVRLLAEGGSRLLIASVEALAQRLPRHAAHATLTIAVGQPLDLADLQADLDRLGYVVEDEADQPGEVAIRGQVIDLVPADGGVPVRIRVTEGDGIGARVDEINRLDLHSRRSHENLDSLTVGPASELVFDSPRYRPAGLEHRLAELAGPLVSAFDLMGDAALVLDPGSDDRMADVLAQIEEARATRIALSRAAGDALPPSGLYLDAPAWQAARDRRGGRVLAWPRAEDPPSFTSRDPLAATLAFIASQTGTVQTGTVKTGRRLRVGLSGHRLVRALTPESEAAIVPVAGWAALLASPPGTLGALPEGLETGFATPDAVVLAASDVLPPRRDLSGQQGLFDIALRPGDAVIHLDHGMARLDGLETVAAGQPSDCVRLLFAGEARKLVPCDEMDRIWRYGAGAGVMLDRADGKSWARRCGKVVAAIDETAQALVAEIAARAERGAPAIHPPRRAMDRFVAGFAYTPTPDQTAAFAAIAADLARPHPMDRLLCGDVGFGKTEAALRAAAGVALTGRQVAVLAPTTVLVRQHLASFRRRLAAIGIEVAALSRLTAPAEARAIRARLADGSLKVVIGTQALAGRGIAFADLALVVIDEEQRFGTRDKTALAALSDGVHTLTLTATPIPRTLEGSLAGLRALSVLTTPPARRQPVRTSVLAFDAAVLKAALLREHARGGQAFCVCPRIDDLDAVAALLGRLVPDLSVVVLHGRMKPDAVDAVIVGFSEGHGDVLLSTDIIEAGLDIPRANTILVWRADHFGLAQLHQLRGRVGRGQARGMAWLFTDPDAPPSEAAAERLAALAAHDGLGAGFAIAARDLDLRGAGDLIGDRQAGHVKLLGVELARHLLAQAMARARGEVVEEDWRPEMVLDLPGAIPADYMPDMAARVALHARLARPHDAAALTLELEDRFGPLPEPLAHLLAQAELRTVCRTLGVARLEVGPAGVAADMRAPPPEIAGLERQGNRLLLRRATTDPATRLALARSLLRLLSRAFAATERRAAA